MSIILGPIVQQGYVVPDVRTALPYFIDIGVGPFFIRDRFDVVGGNCTYRGQEQTFNITAAFTYSGEHQFELICHHNEGPSVYKDFLKDNPEGGLQHVAVWADNIDDELARLKGLGEDFEVLQRFNELDCYIKKPGFPWPIIQLMATVERHRRMFTMVKYYTDRYDGTRPIRFIDEELKLFYGPGGPGVGMDTWEVTKAPGRERVLQPVA